ncbi:MAG: aldehyde dehydrogenase [Bacteroidia bacterium]|nr:aldehyde dehydrogenase [Bacteroidia bacterium]
MEIIRHYIGGRWVTADPATLMDNIAPATGRVYSRVPCARAATVDDAVQAAQAAFPAWANLPAARRAAWLMAIADLIEARMEAFARAESLDTGKPLSLARRMDIPRAVENFRFFAHAITQFSSESHDMGEQGFNYTLRRPIGVAGLISPWNLPLYLFSWKIAPALAAGNTVVAKPSEITPMTASLLAQVCDDAGLPPGVLNIVHGMGPETGEAIVTHPGVSMISFTGSTAVGRRIAGLAAPAFKKISLELGGKNATIVFEDADYEAALAGTLRAGFTNQGQICLCGSRILVHRSLYERFVADLVARVRQLRVGDPLADDTDIGALVSQGHRAKVLHYLDLARAEGGTIETGGTLPDDLPPGLEGGYYLRPAVITGLGPGCRVNQEEIFGPVVTVQPFEDDAEAVRIANSTPYGLSAVIWTSHLARAHRVAAQLATGIVWVNSWLVRDLRTPFGGVRQSGIGREGGLEALRFFTEPKNIYIQL